MSRRRNERLTRGCCRLHLLFTCSQGKRETSVFGSSPKGLSCLSHAPFVQRDHLDICAEEEKTLNRGLLSMIINHSIIKTGLS